MRTHTNTRPSIAVIGAGAAGLITARLLADAGFPVTVVDKSRGLGGRLATRRSDGFAFDHGCPIANIEDREGILTVLRLESMGSAMPWGVSSGVSLGDLGPSGQGFIGTPGNSAMLKPLALGLTVHRGFEVASLDRQGDGWMLIPKQRAVGEEAVVLGPFDWVLVTAPAPQTHALLDGKSAISARVAEAGMEPRWTLMMVPDGSLGQGERDGLRFEDEVLDWAVRNDRKPGREGDEAWVVHARRDWTIANLELDKEQARDVILAAFQRAVPQAVPRYAAAHRWRYSEVSAALGVPCLLDRDVGLGAGGDWCVGPCVADALASGRALAESVRAAATADVA